MYVRRTRGFGSLHYQFLPLLGACLLAATLPYAVRGADAPTERWEEAIRKFEAADLSHPPPKDGVLFVGSSSIREWKLDESFPGKNYVNRGFGGSQLSDS